jgi:hypothetical protein
MSSHNRGQRYSPTSKFGFSGSGVCLAGWFHGESPEYRPKGWLVLSDIRTASMRMSGWAANIGPGEEIEGGEALSL